MATPVGPYAPVVRAGDLLFVSGQIGLDASGQLVEGLDAQTRQSIANLVALLKDNNASLANVVKTTVFLTDIAVYAAVNEIYAELFGDARPARSAVAVMALPKAALVEIEAVAYVG